jgi:leader peptidase (prepilin peptidase)/N-methyltransferase
MDVVVAALTLGFGLIAGSLVTMLVARIPAGIPLTPVSRCPICHHHLSLPESLPVVSWLLCRGRCRHCGNPIPWSVTALEIATAVLCLLVVIQTEPGGWLVLPPLLLVVSLMALIVIDLVHYRLPDVIVAPAVSVSLLVMAVLSVAPLGRPIAVVQALVAGGAVLVAMLIPHLINPAGLGFGDVKLGLLLGVHTGWVGASRYESWSAVGRLTFWAVLLGMLLGLVLAGLLHLLRRVSGKHLLADPAAGGVGPVPFLKTPVPFGPGLSLGALFIVCFPQCIMG